MKAPTIISMKDIRLSIAMIARRAEAGERFIVVRDSRPVFQIEPLGTAGVSYQEPKMSFEEFTKKIDSVRDPHEPPWTPEAVEEVIQEMYRERAVVAAKQKRNASPKNDRKKAA